jgi:hypothetical protein
LLKEVNKLQVIVYELNGKRIVMTPNLDCGLTIEEITAKDVPADVEYAIMDSEEIQVDTELSIITPSIDQNIADIWEAMLAMSAELEALKGGK